MLHWAASHGKKELCMYLLSQQANPMDQDNKAALDISGYIGYRAYRGIKRARAVPLRPWPRKRATWMWSRRSKIRRRQRNLIGQEVIEMPLMA